jgi:FO synthase
MTAVPSTTRRALKRASDGKTLSVDEATVLMSARGAALRELLDVAGALRDLGHGRVVT